MPSSIPPAPGPLVAELLVESLVPLDVASMTAAFAERGYPLRGGDSFTASGNRLLRQAKDGTGGYHIEWRGEQVPLDQLAFPLAEARKWWDEADAVAAHHATIGVAGVSSVVPSPLLAQAHAIVTAAVVDVALAHGAKVLGVLWNGERLYPAELVQAYATTNPALGLLVGFHVPAPNPTTSVFTTGLSVLGFKNIEAGPAADVEEAVRMVQDMALYILQNGDVIGDGHTVGYSATHHLAVREVESMWSGDRVLRLVLAPS
jgi:hypothetical protein